MFFQGSFDVYFYTILEDIFVVIMLYTFIKIILLSSLVELIWPTQFFNRRNSSGVVSFRLRTFTEALLKLRVSGVGFSTFVVLFFIS